MTGYSEKGLPDLLRSQSPDANRIITAFVRAYNTAYGSSPALYWDVSKEEWYRFAFLGDRVLNLIVSQALFTRRGMLLSKGRMTRILSGVVSNGSLDTFLARNGISVEPLIPASIDTQKKRGQRITGTAFEALIGALYCEIGIDDVAFFIVSLFADEIRWFDTGGGTKSELQELLARQGRPPPDYSRIRKGGPDHEPNFTCYVTLDDGCVFTGTGPTKKEAEKASARAALDAIRKEKA